MGNIVKEKSKTAVIDALKVLDNIIVDDELQDLLKEDNEKYLIGYHHYAKVSDFEDSRSNDINTVNSICGMKVKCVDLRDKKICPRCEVLYNILSKGW